MLLIHTLPVLRAAEHASSSGGDPVSILKILRRLSVDEFGELLISLPIPEYPALSEALPSMAPSETQIMWTGLSGMQLYTQTSEFIRVLETAYVRHSRRSLSGALVLDFGCGYGRLTRMMYYYTDPDRIWGVDAWKSSLDECRKVGLLGQFRQSTEKPDRLPTDDNLFDVGLSFSVFTHLTKEASLKALSAIRKSMRPSGVFVLTIRPIEFWSYLYKKNQRPEILTAEMDHKSFGYGFLPLATGNSANYGDSSFALSFFSNIPDWEMLGYDILLHDRFQIAVALRAA